MRRSHLNFTNLDTFNLSHSIFLALILLVCPIKKQLETLSSCVYHLSCTCGVQCNSIKNFCYRLLYFQTAIWLLFEYVKKKDISQRIIVRLQKHLPKGIEKNRLETWNIAENKLHLRCFSNNWYKCFEQIFLTTPTNTFAKCFVLDVWRVLIELNISVLSWSKYQFWHNQNIKKVY